MTPAETPYTFITGTVKRTVFFLFFFFVPTHLPVAPLTTKREGNRHFLHTFLLFLSRKFLFVELVFVCVCVCVSVGLLLEFTGQRESKMPFGLSDPTESDFGWPIKKMDVDVTPATAAKATNFSTKK